MEDELVIMEDPSWLFAIINGRVSNAFNRMLTINFAEKKINITPEQWSVMAYLWENNGVMQQELCDHTFKDKPSMTRLINDLEKKGLVLRKVLSTDRRANHIYVTPEGKQIESICQEVVNDTLISAFEGIPADKIKEAKNVLDLAISNMSKFIAKN